MAPVSKHKNKKIIQRFSEGACDLLEHYEYLYDLSITPNKTDRIYYKEDIEKVISKLRSVGLEVSDVVYEICPTKKTLHCHCLLYSKKYINKYKFPKKKGWQLYSSGKEPDVGWLNYIHKNSRCMMKQKQIIIEHYALHNNMFSPSSSLDD
jgi:hypothetical protein